MTRYEKALGIWKKKDIRIEAELAEAINEYKVSFAFNSGKLENDNITYHDVREIFDKDGVTSYTGDLRTLFEIRNARDANEYMLRCFENRTPITEDLIKEFQRLLTQNTYDSRRWALGERPGEFKKHDFVTGLHEIGAAPEDVHDELAEVLKEISDIPEGSELTAAAYFHAKFENIHPFADGNGRAGRMIMNYYLLLHDHPPIIIFEEDRKQYYSALETWDERQELKPLVAFLEEQTEKTWEKQIEREISKSKGFEL